MPVLGENLSSSSSTTATMAEHIRLRRPRNETNPETDPTNFPPQIPSINQSTRSKSTIASLFNPTPKKKLNNFTQNTFRGFGCTAASSQQVSLPAVIRTSADWDGKKVKKKKKQKNSGSSSNNGNGAGDGSGGNGTGSGNPGNCMVVQDVWCGPGIGLSADAVVGSVDCVVSRKNVSGRGKIDGDKVNQRERERERSSCLARRTVNPESLSFLDSDFPSVPPRPELDVFGPRYYRHVRHPSPDGLAEVRAFVDSICLCCSLNNLTRLVWTQKRSIAGKEAALELASEPGGKVDIIEDSFKFCAWCLQIMMFQNSLLMGGRFDSHDHFRDWRLDVDNMTYEELLDLGDRIGYVSTGLKEDEIGRCLRKTKNSIKHDLSSHLSIHVDKKCTICQEEYEADDEMGKLDCGHSFHIQCIKQWLTQKNACPVCKTAVITRC
ncbi:hypothetical protein JRO89_XS13G0019800 [Xanthoceras sorbifolium]|uniref:RING-type E3 ubiquitin transferase n=1 Tax=Xanthoceras sorbifolium TaxID=99658 RepID=A0ABQ8H616_9ROSI|nr:hypothetical protein JRO89_XS13G0019800 [Xanthoceras sorbifolium]